MADLSTDVPVADMQRASADAPGEAIEQAHHRLAEIVRSMRSVIVAFSGGVDSSLVLKVALDVLGRENVLAATGVSPSLPQRELQAVKSMASALGASLELLETDELLDRRYAANPANRCYFCKTELYRRLSDLAVRRGFAGIANGVNLDDQADFRPGLKAAGQWQIRAPLVEAGMGKQHVRALAQRLGLANWDKPALACLASRVPYGTPVTIGVLAQIERAEAFLYDRGFANFRVRHHQNLARIEVAPADLQRLITEPLRSQVISAFKALGYTYVTIDLQGFRSGSGNEALVQER